VIDEVLACLAAANLINPPARSQRWNSPWRCTSASPG